MGFRQEDKEGRGGFARLWSVENKGKYSTAKMSTSTKPKGSDTYETDFQDGFVRLIGSAHEKASKMSIGEKGVTIKIISCEVKTPYDAEKKRVYTNYIVYDFDVPDVNSSAEQKKTDSNKTDNKKSDTKASSVVEEEELPF